MTAEERIKLENCKAYMKKHYGITPENIDEKLEELRQKFIDLGYRN